MPDADSGAQVGETSAEDAELRTAVKREFLVQVVLLNLGILAFALGAMLLYFRGSVSVGTGLVVVGIAAIAMTYRRYRHLPHTD